MSSMKKATGFPVASISMEGSSGSPCLAVGHDMALVWP